MMTFFWTALVVLAVGIYVFNKIGWGYLDLLISSAFMALFLGAFVAVVGFFFDIPYQFAIVAGLCGGVYFFFDERKTRLKKAREEYFRQEQERQKEQEQRKYQEFVKWRADREQAEFEQWKNNQGRQSERQNWQQHQQQSYNNQQTHQQNTQTRTEIQKCFDVLELPETATFEEVRHKRMLLLQLYHPDKAGNNAEAKEIAEKKTKEVNLAYETLKTQFFRK